MTHAETVAEGRRHALLALCDVLQPGATVYVVRRRRSRSGNTIAVDLLVLACDGTEYHNVKRTNITTTVGFALNRQVDEAGHLVIRADEHDAYELVQELSRAMHGMTNKPLGATAPHADVPCPTDPGTATRAGYTLRLEWI
jgi:hypothetical protein